MNNLRKLQRRKKKKEAKLDYRAEKLVAKEALLNVYLTELNAIIKTRPDMDGQKMTQLANTAVKKYIDIHLKKYKGSCKRWRDVPAEDFNKAKALVGAVHMASNELTQIFINRRLAAAEKEADPEKKKVHELKAQYQKNPKQGWTDEVGDVKDIEKIMDETEAKS